MFEFSKEKMEQEKAERMAKRMFVKMMSDAILTSETAPESMKLSVRVLDKARDLHDSLDDLVKKYCTPNNIANAEILKAVLEYLGMVEFGVKQFIESTPFVPDGDGKEEVGNGNH